MQSGELKEEGNQIIHRVVEKIKRELTSIYFHRFAPINQFAPTLIDIEYHKLNELANKKLRGESEKESLTNILDWQVKNIKFWWEKWPLCLVLTRIFLSLFLILLFTNSVFRIHILEFLLIVVGCFILLLIYLFIRYQSFLGEKKKFIKFKELVIDTFCKNSPVYKILEYKLAICSDYAKFTASLLYNIYPDSELRFIAKFSHVAAGIEINNKIYVLDQCLPIKSLDNWQRINNTVAAIYKLKIDKRSKKKPIDVVFDRIEPNPVKSNESPPKINTEKLTKLTEETARILGIKQISHIDLPCLKIPLPYYARYYDDDEIIKYSLIRKIKNQLENEVCGKMDKISKINISQENERDLIVSVYL